jgi:proton-translocating NAD(P)+ transhydrogenase subunit beta
VSGLDTTTHLLYLLSAVCFVVGLHLMNSPATARRGNQVSAAGMTLAILTTVVVLADDKSSTATAIAVLVLGSAVGAIAGAITARRIAMTARPQLVSVLNAVGGGAAALIALADAIHHDGSLPLAQVPVSTTLATFLDLLIGGVTFSGSVVAAGKLAGRIPGRPIVFRGGHWVNLGLFLVALACGLTYTARHGGVPVLVLLLLAALALGVLGTLPIGGADMPVVISLLNAFTGTAVAMAGFVLESTPLIIAGALVGAAGAILTKLMADAMNRSLLSIVAGGFGTGDGGAPVAAPSGGTVREASPDDAALQLAYASRVVIVPGYGLAAAQAQHELVALAQALDEHGVDVSYGIHPVAGRMPGHMNVLLSEANAPYTQLKDLDEINRVFPTTDVVLVVGANDVTNPAARRPGNAVSGMPILDVDLAKSVLVIKRSMASGYAGMDNELYTNPRTAMLFGDAKAVLANLNSALTAYITAGPG